MPEHNSSRPNPAGQPATDDPTALAEHGRLDLVARLVVEGDILGQHKSPLKGASVEFSEHRQYHPGDEIRHIDWRAYGKTGKYFVKEFEDETNLRCQLMVDSSGSMAYGNSTLSKFDYARQLAASLAYLLLAQRDAVGLTVFDDHVRTRLAPSTQQALFTQVTDTLEQLEPTDESSQAFAGGVAESLGEVLPTLSRRSLVVVISDFLDETDELISALARFRHARHELILFHVVAPEEVDFPFSRPTQFHDLEQSSRRVLVDPHRVRERYLHHFNRFCTRLEQGAAGQDIDYQRVTTSQPYATALGRYLASRSQRRRGR
ncbi:MAG TPA: DUF58 domain-containing protein [Planctomycetaceae bacterium]|jgi:uncharacterized protein (DUF58 family)|nr:DUF58 domain-containing protein [Planctomycetaceae bacterium]